MPELPDLTVYRECIEARAAGAVLRAVRIASPFVLRTVSPTPTAFAGRRCTGITRIGKRLVLHFDDDHAAVIHLMRLGRLAWKPPRAAMPKAGGLAAFDFETGTLLLSESGRKRRASLHLVANPQALGEFDRGGLELHGAGTTEFTERLQAENRTLKRALTDARLFAGIGNAYSDEILHRARLSPLKLTKSLDTEEAERLYAACQAVLAEFTERLRMEAEAAGGWPPKVTAFRPDMAVHGRYKLPCPVCGSPVQRIVYADNEANYCARCQTDGRLLADRALSRLLHDSWPKSVDDV